ERIGTPLFELLYHGARDTKRALKALIQVFQNGHSRGDIALIGHSLEYLLVQCAKVLTAGALRAVVFYVNIRFQPEGLMDFKSNTQLSHPNHLNRMCSSLMPHIA